MAEDTRAVVALFFHVVSLRQRRDRRRFAPQLPGFAHDDLCAPVIFFHLAVNFDELALQLPHIADVLQVLGKNHHGKRTGSGILAEVQEMHTLVPLLHPHDFTRDALDFADMFPASVGRDAIGWG